MKHLKIVSATLIIIGYILIPWCNAISSDSLFTVMDNPLTAKKSFEGNLDANYQLQLGNVTIFSLIFNSTFTWYKDATACSFWTHASNISSNKNRFSEKYALGSRGRYNITDCNYIFGQISWISDRYNGYYERDVLTFGYGRQLINKSIHSFRSEFGPGIYYNKYTNKEIETHLLGYASITYAYQIAENVLFSQGVSILGSEDIALNTESMLKLEMNKHFGLKITYNTMWNSQLSDSTSTREHINRNIIIAVNYKI